MTLIQSHLGQGQILGGRAGIAVAGIQWRREVAQIVEYSLGPKIRFEKTKNVNGDGGKDGAFKYKWIG